MLIDRRTWLGGLGAAVAVPAVARAAAVPPRVVAANVTPAFRAAADRLAAFTTAELSAQGFPGMTVALRSADGQGATIHAGHADLTARTPVGTDTLFKIGSISKSLVAMALYALAGQGRLDLDAPAVKYVPELPLADRSITVAQLISHTAGLPGNAPPFAFVPGGLLWSATAPGARYSYSNSGYDMLAYVIEAASGERFDRALTRLVLRPLGMTGAEAMIRTADRARFARGYQPLRGDLASFPDSPLAEAAWLDIDRAAGSVASTARGMLPYLAFLARVAKGDGAPLFGPALAKRYAAPVIAAPNYGPGGMYGAGLQHYDIEGSPSLFHTGGMIAFSSAMGVDKASGAGCFASVNIRARGYRPRSTVRFGLALMRALAEGKPLPDAPKIVPVPPVADAARYSGRYVGPRGDALVVGPDALTLTAGGARARTVQGGKDRLISDHPAGIGLDFEGGTAGPFTRVWRGGELYGRDTALPQPRATHAALAGVYRSNDPWVGGGVEVFARGDTLVIDGASGRIVPHADGGWRFADPDAATERVWFEVPVAGRPQRLNGSGEHLLRAAA